MIVADSGDENTSYWVKKMGYNIVVENQKDKSYIIGAWNRIVKDYFVPCEFDAFLGLVDDVYLNEGALDAAVQCMGEKFPDLDGVIGFNQTCVGHSNYTFKEFGQCLFGRKFIERYKPVNYQICCPAYSHFYQDEEMYKYASNMGKFHFCKEATLDHNHPSFTGDVDETHNLTRFSPSSPKSKDDKMYKYRKEIGLVWGQSWELV